MWHVRSVASAALECLHAQTLVHTHRELEQSQAQERRSMERRSGQTQVQRWRPPGLFCLPQPEGEVEEEQLRQRSGRSFP
jgi:hypothetical protein